MSATEQKEKTWEVTFELHGEETTVLMRPDDTILQAAELAGLRAPYDCRRGNCLTCAGRFKAASSYNLVTTLRQEAGGAVTLDSDTFLCDEAKDEGFFLSCCSYPVGPGLRVELGVQKEAWQIQYCDRLRDEATRAAALEAVAQVQRGYSERNPDKFVADLERQFEGEGGVDGAA
ncbi:2Fe-2S ferredoxin-type domain-containing protein [Tribonema minus]|uniref:2Fe-2S ferredoxin-type domain-containing protein n=1 Tax=Tribonema minus TaxID=303371 RepID=A0A836CQ20_9STRA|nr:2Fe-2S ferredoxin-type domain-containing protein [Tribonema minus]